MYHSFIIVTTFLPNVQEKTHFSYNFLVKSTHFSDKIICVSSHFSDFLDVFGSVSVLGLSVGKKIVVDGVTSYKAIDGCAR